MSLTDPYVSFLDHISTLLQACPSTITAPTKPLKIAVAVSGGGDSMTLCHLIWRWVQENPTISAVALIVDHGMRVESAAEAQHVADHIRKWGMPATVLADPTVTITHNRQASARDLRYGLMRQWCLANEVPALLLAHHQQDQAETFLLRLARGSGLKGLSAMRPLENLASLTLIRPLLDWPKARITAYLRAQNLFYISDPLNEDNRFDRIKWRKFLPELKKYGLDVATLANTSHRLAESDALLDRLAIDFTRSHSDLWPLGMIRVNRPAFVAAEPAVTFRALQRWLIEINGKPYPPRAEKLVAISQRIKSPTVSFVTTIGGCRFQVQKAQFYIIPNRQPCQQDALSPLAGFMAGFEDGAMVHDDSIFMAAGDGWKNWRMPDLMTEKFWRDLALPALARRNIPVIALGDGAYGWPAVENQALTWQKATKKIVLLSILQNNYGTKPF